MVLAIFGCLFGILGIFTIGIVFVPLAALCVLFGLISGIAKGQFSTIVLSGIAAILTVWGWIVSPSMWLLTGLLVAQHSESNRHQPVAAETSTPGYSTPPSSGSEQGMKVDNPPQLPLPQATVSTATSSAVEGRSSQPPLVSAFRDGQADRQAWEAWFADLSGQFRAGAEFWAAQRSLPHPAGCFAAGGRDLGAWSEGCLAAQQRLAPSDQRRRADPEYRRGWNNP